MAAILTLGVAGVVMGAFSIGAYLNSSQLYEEVIEGARANAQAQAETIRIALEHQMLQKDRSVIDSMVRSFANDPLVNAVMILDWQGTLKYTSKPLAHEADISMDSPTCQACHDRPAETRDYSKEIETQDGEILRIATPIRNRPACHACHSPLRRMNGLLLVDVKVGELKERLGADVRQMILVSGLLALLALAGVSIIIRVAFLRRLRIFEQVARAITAGDLEKRLPVKGDDTLAWLALQFNALTDSIIRLLDDVRRRSEHQENVLNALDDGIIVLDRDMRIVAVNDALLGRVGRARDEVLGATCHDVMGGTCGQQVPCSIRACLDDEEGRHSLVIPCAGPDGQIRHEEVQASVIRDKDGAVEYVVESWRDITRRRATEAQLAESHRLASLGMLASGFSHELNTPLATILTCVEGIGRSADDSELDVEYISSGARIAKEQLLRCRAITQQFLRMARGESTGEDVLELGLLVDSTLRLIEPTARESGIVVLARKMEEQVFVRAPEAELQQVLLNLVLNGVQACDPGGCVEVSVLSGTPVRIVVRDDGRGITEEEASRILEPFYSKRPGGTGLGLFISQQIIRKWGGTIDVESTPGIGSTFTVTVPVDEDVSA